MCTICDGATLDEFLFGLHAKIERNGFTQVSVEGKRPWTYSIGLAALGHPELVVSGLHLGDAYLMIDRLARRVLAGESFEEAPRVTEAGDTFDLVPVHPWHLRHGLMNMWVNYYGSLGPEPPRLAALQILAPRSWTCCYSSQRRLDRPGGHRRGRRA